MVSEKQMARLLDPANLACQKGLVGEARTIFQAVLALRPGFAPALWGWHFLMWSWTISILRSPSWTRSLRIMPLMPTPLPCVALPVCWPGAEGMRSRPLPPFRRIAAAADMARASWKSPDRRHDVLSSGRHGV